MRQSTVTKCGGGGTKMFHFYRFMLAMTRFELQIARTTGRNPKQIAALRHDELSWEKSLQLLELNK